MPKQEKPSVDRRNFLKNAALTGAASIFAPAAASPALLAAAQPPEISAPSKAAEMTTDRPGR